MFFNFPTNSLNLLRLLLVLFAVFFFLLLLLLFCTRIKLSFFLSTRAHTQKHTLFVVVLFAHETGDNFHYFFLLLNGFDIPFVVMLLRLLIVCVCVKVHVKKIIKISFFFVQKNSFFICQCHNNLNM